MFPPAGDWRYLFAYNGSTVHLAHCDVRYAGRGSVAAVEIYTSAATIDNCQVRDNLENGVQLSGAGLSPTISNGQITNNGGDAITQNTFNMRPLYQNLTLTGNGRNAVVTGGGTVGGDMTVDGSPAALGGSPYVLNGAVYVDAGATLTMTAGTTLQFNTGYWLQVQAGGELVSEGTDALPITFTAAIPAAGQWHYVYFPTGSSGRLAHCEISYAGRSNNAALDIRSSEVTVDHCRIHDNLDEGVQLTGAALSPSLSNLLIEDNGGRAVSQSTINMGPA